MFNLDMIYIVFRMSGGDDPDLCTKEDPDSSTKEDPDTCTKTDPDSGTKEDEEGREGAWQGS